MLTALIRAIGKYPAWSHLEPYMNLISHLLSQKPRRQHQQERTALSLLAKHTTPIASNSKVFSLARSLIQRGADVNARYKDGCTPLQSWCNLSTKMTSAAGMILLLEAGADMDALYPTGHTILWTICERHDLQRLSELASSGWLEVFHLDIPCFGVANQETPTACLQRNITQHPSKKQILLEMLELFAAYKERWRCIVRPAIQAHLESHPQLNPDLSKLILCYVDGKSSIHT